MTKKKEPTRLVMLPFYSDNGLFDYLVDSKVTYKIGDTLTSNDILAFGGGVDINPFLYKQSRLFVTDVPHKTRDACEMIAFYEAIRVGASCLGICRGAQFLTIMAGGSLIQHVSGHTQEHYIRISEGLSKEASVPSELVASSLHHQMMYPFQLSEDSFTILATPTHRISHYYNIGKPCNNKNDQEKLGEGVIHLTFDKVPLEPEIIYYPKIRALAIQGHPEFMSKQSDFSKLSVYLVGKYLTKNIINNDRPLLN